MGLRFFRRIRVMSGLWLNVSRSGLSWSVGVRGLRMTFGKSGTRLTAGLPGSGLSVTKHVRHGSPEVEPPCERVGRRLLDKALRGE